MSPWIAWKSGALYMSWEPEPIEPIIVKMDGFIRRPLTTEGQAIQAAPAPEIVAKGYRRVLP